MRADAGRTAGEALPTLDELTPEGWFKAVRRFLSGRDDDLAKLDALLAGRHGSWRGYLALPPGGRVLCLGSGYGAVVESLAPHCRQVVVLEPDPARLRFVRQRIGIFNAEDDVVLVRAAAGETLPFASGSFDAVIMAEPLGPGGPARLLGEARRVLREGGQVLLITDNRFSLALPSGWWDRWDAAPKPLPILARTSGLLLAWARRQNGPQALPTLCRRLSDRGFTDVRTYGLWPSRRQFDEVIPLYDGRPAALPGKPPSWRQRLKQHGLFLPAHCVTAWAGGERQPTSYERIYAAAARQIAGGQDAAPLLALRHILTRKDKMIVQAMRDAEPVIVRIPFSRAAAEAEARHAAALARLADTHPGLAPRPLAAGQIDGFDYRVETALPGAALSTIRGRVGPEAVLHRAANLLALMNPAASLVQAPLAGAAYDRLIEARLERLFRLVRERDQQVRLRAFFRDRLSGVSLTFGLVHGDFSRSNIYLDGDNAGIVDWEAADFDDLPILDAIGFLESVLRPLGARRSLAESFYALARLELPSMAEERFLFAQYERLGIERGHHRALTYLRWLRQIDHLLPYWLNYDPRGQAYYIHQVVRLLLAEDVPR